MEFQGFFVSGEGKKEGFVGSPVKVVGGLLIIIKNLYLASLIQS